MATSLPAVKALTLRFTERTYSGLVHFNSQALWAAEVQVSLHRRACFINKLLHCLLLAVKLLPGCQSDLENSFCGGSVYCLLDSFSFIFASGCIDLQDVSHLKALLL